jgi:hypothetical protein
LDLNYDKKILENKIKETLGASGDEDINNIPLEDIISVPYDDIEVVEIDDNIDIWDIDMKVLDATLRRVRTDGENTICYFSGRVDHDLAALIFSDFLKKTYGKKTTKTIIKSNSSFYDKVLIVSNKLMVPKDEKTHLKSIVKYLSSFIVDNYYFASVELAKRRINIKDQESIDRYRLFYCLVYEAIKNMPIDRLRNKYSSTKRYGVEHVLRLFDIKYEDEINLNFL